MSWFSSRIQKQHVIPVFRGGKRTCSGAGARPRKDRNPVPETEDAGLPAVALFFKTGGMVFIAAGRIWIPVFVALSSTVLRPQSTFAKKTGMTVVSVVCNERRCYIFVAPQAPLLPGEVPDEVQALSVLSATRCQPPLNPSSQAKSAFVPFIPECYNRQRLVDWQDSGT